MKTMTTQGVLILMAHLIVTLAVLIIYAVGSIQGHADDTLKTLLFAIIGYWFGSLGITAVKGQTQAPTPPTQQAQSQEQKGA